MKKLYIFVLVFMMISIGLPLSYADTGPKPTTDVEIIGLDEPYYFDLLAEFDEEDVVELDSDQITEQILYDYYFDDYPDVLNGYRDADGFASYTLYTQIPHNISKNENVYHCGYFAPPDIFKIVIVTEAGDMIVSEIMEKQLFNAYVTFDLSDFDASVTESVPNDDVIAYYPVENVTESIPVVQIIIQVLVTLVATIIIEGLILLAFGYRDKKSFLLILYVNIITQALLYAAIDISYLYASVYGWVVALILGEVIVFAAEIGLYIFLLKEKTKKRAALYAILANLISFGIGFASIGVLALFM